MPLELPNIERKKEEGGDIKYPVGGYAPGNYYGKCATCGKLFQGEKLAFQCEPCGEASERCKIYVLEVLDFIAATHKFPDGTTGESLHNEYKKKQYNDFIEQRNTHQL